MMPVESWEVHPVRILLLVAAIGLLACTPEAMEDDLPRQGAAGAPAEANGATPAEMPAATAAPGTPIVMGPEEGDVLWFFNESPDELGSGGELRIFLDHVTQPDAGGGFAKFTLGVGGSLPVHRHDATEEIAYIVSGEGVAIGIDGEGGEIETPIAGGYVWYNPHGIWHAVRNTGETPLVMVFATIPNVEKGLLAFFRAIGVEPGDEAVAIPAEEFGRLAAEHDMILRPPDPAEQGATP